MNYALPCATGDSISKFQCSSGCVQYKERIERSVIPFSDPVVKVSDPIKTRQGEKNKEKMEKAKLEKMSVADLKGRLRDAGMSKSGVNGTLILRLGLFSK
jgi:hypothetical protein